MKVKTWKIFHAKESFDDDDVDSLNTPKWLHVFTWSSFYFILFHMKDIHFDNVIHCLDDVRHDDDCPMVELKWHFSIWKKKSKSNERVWRLFSQKLFDKPTSLTSLTNSITNFYHKQWRVIWCRQRNAHWHWQSVIYKVCSLLFNQILILKKSILRFDFSQSKLLI